MWCIDRAVYSHGCGCSVSAGIRFQHHIKIHGISACIANTQQGKKLEASVSMSWTQRCRPENCRGRVRQHQHFWEHGETISHAPAGTLASVIHLSRHTFSGYWYPWQHSNRRMSVSVRPVLWDLPAMCHISLFGKPALIFMGVASPVLRQCYAFEFIISAMRATLPCTLAAASCFRTENQHIALQERSVLRGMPYTTYPEFEHGFCKSSSLTLSLALSAISRSSPPLSV